MSARQRRRKHKRRRQAARLAQRRNRLLAGAGITVGATLAAPVAAEAATFPVTSLADDGGAETLRGAIAQADATGEFDRVLFDSGLSGTIDLGSSGAPYTGEIEIKYPIEIVGPGPGRVTVNADVGSRIFVLPNPVPYQVFLKATISGLTLSGGDPGDPGGAIAAYGADLTLLDSVISGNTADGPGGGIFGKYSEIELDSTDFSGNDAEYGGAIYAVGSTVSINASTVSGNTAEEDGGGLEVYYADSLLVTNSTISGNTAEDDDGGGIYSYGSNTTISNSTISGNTAHDGGGISTVDYPGGPTSKLTARNTTIAANSAYDDGGGMDVDGYMHAALFNTIVATNTASDDGPNIDNQPPNEPVEAGFTLIDDTTDAYLTETTPGSNVIGVNPQLGPLAANGGPTQTMALSNTSPALDKGDGFGAKRDQRALTRPIELPGILNSTAAGADGSDIGAFELQGIAAGVTPTAGAAFRCRGRDPTIVAQPGVPTFGTKRGDVIVGTLGPDEIHGRGGRDLICAWDGNDLIFGGGGNDTIVGQRGDDLVKGQGGRDRLGGGFDQDRLIGGGGRDGLIGGPDADVLIGGGGLDRLFGKQGPDRLFGNKGPDRLFGGPGPDDFNGGPGRNILHLIRGDGDKLFGNNADSRVLISGRAKRKKPPG